MRIQFILQMTNFSKDVKLSDNSEVYLNWQ